MAGIHPRLVVVGVKRSVIVAASGGRIDRIPFDRDFEFGAGSEVRHPFCRDFHVRAALGIPHFAGLPVTDAKRAEPGNGHSVSAEEACSNALDEGVQGARSLGPGQ